jgi:mono/diheme cytochrome c family protein
MQRAGGVTMSPMRILPLASVAVVLLAGGFGSARLMAQSQSKAAAPSPAPALRTARKSLTDLELGGDLAGVPEGETRFLSREDLLARPQHDYTVSDDSNFAHSVHISGVLLDHLLRDLSGSPTEDMVVAICDDKYHAYYPQEYLALHHPLLVLKVNSQPPSRWPKNRGASMGPYLVSHPKFVPSFRVLSDDEEAQIPWGVVRIEFRNERKLIGAIAPHGPDANRDTVQSGFKIAQQNCFRCHNLGSDGGEKSGVPWQTLGVVAKASPAFFADYIRHPELKNPKTQMEGDPSFDDETISAVTKYFVEFAPKAVTP